MTLHIRPRKYMEKLICWVDLCNRDLQLGVRGSTTFQTWCFCFVFITFHSTLVPIVSFQTGQQKGGVRPLGT